MFLSSCSARKFGNAIPQRGTDPDSPASQRRELWQSADRCKPRSVGCAVKGKFTAHMHFPGSLGGKVFSVADVRNAPVQRSAGVFEE